MVRHLSVGWIFAFLSLAAMGFAVSRPQPRAADSTGDRVVVDQRHKAVHIALPFRGAVLTDGAYIPRYLEITRKPDTLLAITSLAMGDRVTGHLINRVFPRVMDALRSGMPDALSKSSGPKTPIERLLLFDAGVFMGWYTLAGPIEQAGIPFVGFRTFPASDEERAQEVNIYAGVVGEQSRGNDIIAYDRDLYRQLDQELNVATLSSQPTYLYLGSQRDGGAVSILGRSNHYTRLFLPHAGVMNACLCPGTGAIVDAEQIASYDPDIIVLDTQNKESPQEFINDPRWQGLKAVRNRAVYIGPSGLEYYIAPPFWSRWLAEIAHPNRLRPKVRTLYRQYVQWLLDYRLSDEELDTAFQVDKNRGMTHAERFEALSDAR